MSSADAVAAMLWTGVTAYAVFGGADFGAGFWSLVAGGGEEGTRARELIDWAIGPVWEANHVWLIFVLVVLWTGFSEAFEARSITITSTGPLRDSRRRPSCCWSAVKRDGRSDATAVSGETESGSHMSLKSKPAVRPV